MGTSPSGKSPVDLSTLSLEASNMIKEFKTENEIDRWIRIVGSSYLTTMWDEVKDSYEKAHWVSAFNFRLAKFFAGEEIGH